MPPENWRLFSSDKKNSKIKKAPIILIDEESIEIKTPKKAGITLESIGSPWSIRKIEIILKDSINFPSEETFRASRHARHRLSQFWLNAPVDLVEPLYTGRMGKLQRLFLTSSLINQDLCEDERDWRQYMRDEKNKSERSRQSINFILAIMLYRKPLTFRVKQPKTNIPEWLIDDYLDFCEPDLKSVLRGPAGLLQPGHQNK